MTIVAILDTETTGISDKDRVLEVGLVIVEVTSYWMGPNLVIKPIPGNYSGREVQIPHLQNLQSSLVRPGVPVSPKARATHHISDAELNDAPTMTELYEQGWLDPLLDADVVACHNLSFDAQMMQQSAPVGTTLLPTRRICTLQCARHLFPDEDSHANQALRYSLGLELGIAGVPHRAMYDAMVTGLLLARMLATRTLDELEELTKRPAFLKTCPVGKFRGQPWENVDSGMLRWILGREFSEDIHHTARHHLNARRK